MIIQNDNNSEGTLRVAESQQDKHASPLRLSLPTMLKIFLPDEDIELWVKLSKERACDGFLRAYFESEPTWYEWHQVRRELHFLAGETGYKVKIKRNSKHCSECWSIREYRYKKLAKRRQELRTPKLSSVLSN